MIKKLLKVILLCSFYLQARIEHKSSYPFIAGDTFRAFADLILDSNTRFNPDTVSKGSVIFVQIDHLQLFFEQYHPKIQNPYILLTHRCEGDLDDDPIPSNSFRKWVDDPKLIAWFSQNIDELNNPKLKHLPIGLSNHVYPHGNTNIFKDVMSRTHSNRDKLLYMNFSVNTYPIERSFVYNLFNNKRFCTVKNRTNLQEYLTDLQNHKFALSPRGNGLDCHRTWEALLMGTIPVVKSSTLDPLFEELPVLIIDDWHMVTEEFLERKYKEIMSKTYNKEKLFADYWFNQIKKCKEEYLKNN